MCCNKQRQQTYCAIRYQQRRDLERVTTSTKVASQDSFSVSHQYTYRPRWSEYQPPTMAGMIVMGLAMGVHEGVKKIQDKKEERKANKAALQMEAHHSAPGQSSATGSARGRSLPKDLKEPQKNEEVRQDQASNRRGSSSFDVLNNEDAPPSYEAAIRPTYEEAMQHSGRRV